MPRLTKIISQSTCTHHVTYICNRLYISTIVLSVCSLRKLLFILAQFFIPYLAEKPDSHWLKGRGASARIHL